MATIKWNEKGERRWIDKSSLVDGAYYYGICRNARVARWDAEDGRFWYRRKKFDYEYIEPINCPEDDNGFDLFYPFAEVDIRPVNTPSHKE